MSDFSVYYRNKVGDHMLRNQSFTPPATIYVALFTALTGLSDNNPTAELTGLGYARVAVSLEAFAAGASYNGSDIDFAAASGGDWAEATHFALVDHLSNTNWGTDVNVLMWDELTTPRTCLDGDQAKFTAEELDVTIK